MTLGFRILPASDMPIFRQLMQQIQRAVAAGNLRVGEQLPAVRVLAEELVINPNTVARAYQELIRDGVLESRAGRGVFVTERRPVFSEAERDRRLEQAAGQLCHEAILLGAGLPEIRKIVDQTWNELQSGAVRPEPSTERKKK
jgi:GntR family transcriptional regulator